MYRIKIWPLILLVATIGCYDNEEPEYSAIPLIELAEVEYIDATDQPGNNDQDTLRLTFDITDGDFDLGLDATNVHDIDSPYHSANYFLLSSSGLVETAMEYEIINNQYYRILRSNTPGKVATIGFLRRSLEEIPPYDCVNYEYGTLVVEETMIDNTFNIEDTLPGPLYVIVDTFMFKRNEGHYNIMIDFLEEENGGYQQFLWEQPPYCITFDGRFFRLEAAKMNIQAKSPPFVFLRKSKRKGQLTYSMISRGFKFLFGGKNLKLKVQVMDRALNKSNIIETDPFTIP